MVVIVVAILNGGTLNQFRIQPRETVPPNQIHLGETVPPFKMNSRGTVPLFKVLSASSSAEGI